MRRIIGMGAAFLFAVACGGGGSQTAPATQAASAEPMAAATSAPTSTITASQPTQAGPKLIDLVKAGRLASYKVTYKWTVSGQGQSMDSQQTWYYKPPKARYDYALAGAGGATFSVYALEDGTYFCTNAGGTAFCQKTSAEAAFQQNAAADFDLQVSGKPDQFSATFTGSKTIAGQQAQCFGVKSLAGGAFGDVTSCYSTTGIPLSMQVSSQGSSFSMEATSFSTTVSDADFKLPGPVR